MDLLSFFHKKNVSIDGKIYSPINGVCIPLEEVPDKVFSSKMMGPGIGFRLEDNVIYAPCDATVSMVAETKHAIGLKADSGAEILIHIGLDTVQLEGKGFEVRVKENDKVKRGQPLILVDFSFMKENNVDLTTPLVITNSDDIKIQIIAEGGIVAKDYCIMECGQ